MKKLRMFVTAVAVAVPVMALGAAPAQADVTDITVGIGTNGPGPMITWAIDKGYLAKNGLNATTLITPNANLLVQNLASGRTQFMTITLASAMTARTNGGVDLVVVAPGHGISYPDAARMKKDPKFAKIADQSVLCVRPDRNINSGKDLEGKTMSVSSRGGMAELAISTYVRRSGGDYKKVNYTVLPSASMLPALKRGQFDGSYLPYPFHAQCELEGMKSLTVADSQMIPDGGPVTAWYTTRQFANDNPNTVKAFQKSIYEATTAVQGGSAKAKATMQEMLIATTKVTKLPVEEVLATKPLYFFNTLTKANVQVWADAMQRAGLVVKPVDVPGFILTQYRR